MKIAINGAGQIVSTLTLGFRVVRTFNSIFARSLLANGRPAGTPARLLQAIDTLTLLSLQPLFHPKDLP